MEDVFYEKAKEMLSLIKPRQANMKAMNVTNR